MANLKTQFYEIKIEKITDKSLMTKALQMCGGNGVKTTLSNIYQTMHSPIRTQLFWIELLGIPTFVSVHLVRHSTGITHFVSTNREDINPTAIFEEITRNTPVNHGMLINAEALINMSHKRMCMKAHVKTRTVFTDLARCMIEVDIDLAKELKPTCFYRNGLCPELKPCGVYKQLHILNKQFFIQKEQTDFVKSLKYFEGLSNCKKRGVGCVIAKQGMVIGSGYNAIGDACKEKCSREGLKSGERQDLCKGTHAEIESFRVVENKEDLQGADIYVSCFPCIECAKEIAKYKIKNVYYIENYDNNAALNFLTYEGVICRQIQTKQQDIIKAS